MSEVDTKESLREIRQLQGRFLKSAREWRRLETDQLQKKCGLPLDRICEIENGQSPILVHEWISVASALNILDDAEIFFLLLEGAFDERKKKARHEVSSALKAMGFNQLKLLEEFQLRPSQQTSKVLSFRERRKH